jgi:hypothetical protein
MKCNYWITDQRGTVIVDCGLPYMRFFLVKVPQEHIVGRCMHHQHDAPWRNARELTVNEVAVWEVHES